MTQVSQERAKHYVSTDEELSDDQIRAAREKSGQLATAEAVSNEDLDQLLEDIDDVLETNANEFVSHFVQRGGQ